MIPRASIIIPVYNQRPEYLLTAVNTALEQSVPVEIIIVDDGCDKPIPTGGPATVIRHAENRGVAHALNTGFTAMTTEWFAWLSSDDMIDPRKIELQLEAMAQRSARASFHQYRIMRNGSIVGHNWMPSWQTREDQWPMLGKTCVMNGSTIMLHRSVFDDCGGFDPDFRYGQDWEMWCLVGRKVFLLPIHRELGTRREHDGNLTQTIERAGGQMKGRRDAEDAVIRERYAA